MFLMFAIFNYAIIFYSFFLLKETAGKSLEEMEVVFGTVDRLPMKGTEDGGVTSGADDDETVRQRSKRTSIGG